MVLSLKELIDRNGLDFFNDAISRFSCKDEDVELFLREKAVDFERRDKSRTYLILDDETNTLLGYYTLSLKALPFGSGVSKSAIKAVDGFSKDIDAVGIILIGQFGKDKVSAQDVDGKHLFDICLETVYRAQKIVGGRFVLIECRDLEKVVSFYTRQGFEALQYDESDRYLQMVRRL
jgi:hypothetical protein